MTQTIDPRILYSRSPFFLDYIEGKDAATEFFEHSIHTLHRLAEARQIFLSPQARSDICDVLHTYNRALDASSKTMERIERLRDPKALCVVGGQQVGFLGGPLFVLYKIASIIRTAAWLSDRLEVPVVPIFWLASEDHDFAEINHTRWMDDSGAIRTISFDWDRQGRPIEQLTITEAVRQAFADISQKIRFSEPSEAAIFTPAEDDTYCTWHARIWSRLFAQHGLILVEPRVLRPLAERFFARALSEVEVIRMSMSQSAARLTDQGYPVPLEPDYSGTLFEIPADGRRKRIEQPIGKPPSPAAPLSAVTYSTDVALRPLLADSLLPSVANILGPSELAYHAMLRPLYEQWGIPQPLAIPRQSAIIITKASLELLSNLGIGISEALHPEFSPGEIAKRLASTELSSIFSEARTQLEEALLPLKDHLCQLDPGLETRWHQMLDQVLHQVERLEDRAIRAELARRGVSVRNLQNLKPLLRPTGKAQERILSAFSFIAKHGVEWIHEMIVRGKPDRFEHQLIVLEESHE